MVVRIIMGVVLIGSLSGCTTTTRQPTATNQLQIRMAHVENQLDAQGEDIEDIKSDMEDISTRLTIVQDKTGSIKVSNTVRKTVSTPPPAKKASKSKSPGILRVPVAPKEVQLALQNAGYYKGAIDGVLGSGSKKAIKEFQTDHDLESDGIIGKKTWAELKNYIE